MFARRSIALGLALVLSSAPLLAIQSTAPDLTGTWTGKFRMTNKEVDKEESGYVVLKQTKNDLSGTARDQFYPDNKITVDLQRK